MAKQTVREKKGRLQQKKQANTVHQKKNIATRLQVDWETQIHAAWHDLMTSHMHTYAYVSICVLYLFTDQWFYPFV